MSRQEWVTVGDEYRCCPYEATVAIEPQVICSLMKLVNEVNTEFMVFAVGTANDNCFHVTDVELPEQEVSGTSCRLLGTLEINHGYIGVIHSHVAMDAFHSGTDDAYLEVFPFSLVLNRMGDYLLNARVLTPCGIVIRKETKGRIWELASGCTEFPTDRIHPMKEYIPMQIPAYKNRWYEYAWDEYDWEYDEGSIWDDIEGEEEIKTKEGMKTKKRRKGGDK